MSLRMDIAWSWVNWVRLFLTQFSHNCFLVTFFILKFSSQSIHVESPEQRGQILATGQRIRFCFSLLAGAIQTFLLNSRATNKADCPISFDQCWSWGLSIQGYYGLLFAIVAVLVIPICWLKEIPSKHPAQSCRQFFIEMYDLDRLIFFCCPTVLTSCFLIHLSDGTPCKIKRHYISSYMLSALVL